MSDRGSVHGDWKPGATGRFVITTAGELRCWAITGDPEAERREEDGTSAVYLMVGVIDPDVRCWAVERDASCGPDLVERVFASDAAAGLVYAGRRSSEGPPVARVERQWGRDPDRIPIILGALEREWRKAPDLRLGQLLINQLRSKGNVPRELEGPALFGLEDGALLQWLGPETVEEKRYVKEEPRRRRQGWNAWLRWARKTNLAQRPPEGE